MASIGMNVARDGHIAASTVRALGATWIRVVAMPDIDLAPYFRELRAAGVKILLVLARESGGDYSRYQRLYGALADAVQVGNEPDLASPSSWTMTPAELVSLAREARKAFPRPMPLVCAGLASGQPSWLQGMDLSSFDALGVHAYLKDAPNPSDIEDLTDVPELLDGYRAYGLPLLITEWGWWSDDEPRASEEVRDMARWAAQTGDIEAFFYFCASDSMVPPFGLLNADGSEKPRARAFREAAGAQVHSLWPQVKAPPVVQPPPVVDLRAYARAAAVRNGYPPLQFERQIQQESGFDPDAFNASSGATGIAQIIERFHPEMAGKTRDPIASLDYAAGWMAQLRKQFGSYKQAIAAYNWGPGNVSRWDGQPGTLPVETRHYLDVILGPGWPEPGAETGRVRYNRDEPAHAQEESFDCSQESLEWALWAYGRQTSDDWLETAMMTARPPVMTAQNGLEDASGAGLARFIREQYAELGYDANHENPISFDALAAEFGPGNPYPGLIGGRAWGHWSGLRSYDPARDVLLLANPSDGHKGVGQTMSRQQFTSLGPFSMVRVLHKDVLAATAPQPPAPQPAAVTRAELAPIIAQLQAIHDRLPSA